MASSIKKVLFFTPSSFLKNAPVKFAPSVVCYSNYKSLCDIYGVENVHYYLSHTPPSTYIKRIMSGFKSLLFESKQEKKLLCYLKDYQIDIIFLGFSHLKIPIRKIRRYYPHIRIITFFHNYESDLSKKILHHTFRKKNFSLTFYKQWLSYFLTTLREKSLIYHSDMMVVMTDRDKEQILKFYPNIAPCKLQILPICIYDDAFSPNQIIHVGQSETVKLLFVASDWLPNVEGLDYYLREVMPKLSIPVRLDVIGGVCLLRNKFQVNQQVYYHDYIENIDQFYYDTDAVISPLFYGGGMKVKVAEALMYGKFIFMTTESAMGYSINEDIGSICDTAEGFVEKINQFLKQRKIQKFNPASRKLFENFHSASYHTEKMKAILTLIMAK